MSKLIKNYIYTVLYQIFVLIVPVITAPYLARVLGATNLGIYSYVSTASSIISAIVLLGIYNYGNRQIAYVRNDQYKVNQTFWELMLIRFVLGTLGTIIYFLIGVNSEYKFYFFLNYAWILASFMDISWVFVGFENMKPAVKKNFLAKLTSVIGIFIFVKSKEDIWKYIIMLSITTLFANLSVYGKLKTIIGKPSINKNRLKQHVLGSLQLFLPQVASILYLQVGKIMIEFFTGETNQVAFYDQAEKIVTIPMTIITALSTVMMPRIANEYSNGKHNLVKEYLLKAGNLSLFFAIPMSLGIANIANDFIPWYLGKEFTPVAYAMIILSPIIITNSLVGISGSQYFTATNQINILFISYLVAGFVNLIANAVLIKYYGFIGSAVATLLSSIVLVFFQYKRLNKQMAIKPLLNSGVKYFFVSMPMVIVILFLALKLPSEPYTTCIQIIIGIFVYFCSLFLIKDEILVEIISKLKLLTQMRLKKGKL